SNAQRYLDERVSTPKKHRRQAQTHRDVPFSAPTRLRRRFSRAYQAGYGAPGAEAHSKWSRERSLDVDPRARAAPSEPIHLGDLVVDKGANPGELIDAGLREVPLHIGGQPEPVWDATSDLGDETSGFLPPPFRA